jgi:predicted nucleic acid-binding protein
VTEHFETLVLDSQGVSAWVSQDRKIVTMLQVFHSMGADPVISANTIVEVSHGRVNMPRLNWVLSRLKIEPVTGQTAKAAAELLKTAGLHGHKYAIDATVAETALRQPGPVAILTSDVDDMRRLCGERVRLIGMSTTRPLKGPSLEAGSG